MNDTFRNMLIKFVFSGFMKNGLPFLADGFDDILSGFLYFFLTGTELKLTDSVILWVLSPKPA